jgi:hypothetical protein
MVSILALERAFNRVRRELAELGLLADGIYLDRIDLARSLVPTFRGLMGWVYDQDTGFWRRLLGFREGVIYIPINAPVGAQTPGGTLVDVIRHEFGHAWEWVDRRFFRGRWFHDAFGPHHHDRSNTRHARHHFVSPYAMTSPSEDLAESFMYYLRHRRSLARFKSRHGVYRKLHAIELAVRRKRRQLGL